MSTQLPSAGLVGLSPGESQLLRLCLTSFFLSSLCASLRLFTPSVVAFFVLSCLNQLVEIENSNHTFLEHSGLPKLPDTWIMLRICALQPHALVLLSAKLSQQKTPCAAGCGCSSLIL